MHRTRSSFVSGILLILIGGYALAAQFIPALKFWENLALPWPIWVVGSGGLLFVLGLILAAPGMAVPASIVGGVGAILWYQNATGDWQSWVYLWTLIPGFVGVGTILAGVLEGKTRQSLRSGGWLIVVSLGLLAFFSVFFARGLLRTYWPVLLIAWGGWILIQPLLRRPRA